MNKISEDHPGSVQHQAALMIIKDDQRRSGMYAVALKLQDKGDIRED